MMSGSPHVSAEIASATTGRPYPTLHHARLASSDPWGKGVLPGVVAAVLYLVFLLYLTVVLQFPLLQSDVLAYWQESQGLAGLFSTWWVPGYPALLALVRAGTADMLPPLAVMLLTAGTSYVVAVSTVFALATERRLRHPDRVALLFALYPVVGLTYTVWPISDITAVALLLGCLLAFERKRWLLFTVYAACALLMHKAMWFFVPPLLAVALIEHTESRRLVPWALVPLLVWLVAGAIHHGDAFWFARWAVTHLVVSRSTLPVLDGLIGPFVAGGAGKALKGMLIVATITVALATVRVSIRSGFWGGAAIAGAVVVLGLLMNQYEIWVVARFSKVLVIPVAVALEHTTIWRGVVDNRRIYALLLMGCAVSNLGFGYYMAKAFFA